MNSSNTVSIQGLRPDITDMNFADLFKAKPDLTAFRVSDGTVNQNLRKTFKKLMIDTGLLVCPCTGQNRTIFSFKHT